MSFRFNKTVAALAVAGTMLFTSAQAATPAASDFVKPVAEYKLYVLQEISELVKDTKAFTDAVKSGDIEKAKALYAPTRLHYEATEPAAELFGDLDPAIDAREDDFKEKVNDPNFTGFHRLEYILWDQKTTKGAEKYADGLMENVLELQKRLQTEQIPVVTMVQGAADLMEEVAQTKITGEEDRYSRTDLWDFEGNLQGSKKIVSLLEPLIKQSDAALWTKLQTEFAATQKTLDKYRTKDDGFQVYEAVTEADKTLMKSQVAALSESLATLRGALGLAN